MAFIVYLPCIVKSGFAEVGFMPRAIAVIIELLAFACAMWVISFLSTLLHELGHSVGYMFATWIETGIYGSEGESGF